MPLINSSPTIPEFEWSHREVTAEWWRRQTCQTVFTTSGCEEYNTPKQLFNAQSACIWTQQIDQLQMTQVGTEPGSPKHPTRWATKVSPKFLNILNPSQSTALIQNKNKIMAVIKSRGEKNTPETDVALNDINKNLMNPRRSENPSGCIWGMSVSSPDCSDCSVWKRSARRLPGQ